MNLQSGITQRNLLRSLLMLAAITLTLSTAGVLTAQSSDNKPADSHSSEAKAEDSKPVHTKPDTVETFYLANSPTQNDLNDIQTALRNVLSNARIYGVPSQRAIVVFATKDEVATARKLITELDKKRNTYRLTYTLTEKDGAKRHYSLVANSGEKATMKLGDRVPIMTGKLESGSTTASEEVQYIDLGLYIEVNLDTASDSLRLRSKFEQSNIADERSATGGQDPTIHQSSLESNAALLPGKPLVLGTIDLPGSSHPFEVEVIAELVK